MDRYNAISLLGMGGLLALAWLFSKNRRRVNKACLFWSLVLQGAIGFLVFQNGAVRGLFLWLNNLVLKITESASAGQIFLFGPLADGSGQGKSAGFILAFQALPIIIFFSALMGLLYHWRIMPRIIQAFAWVFTRLMKISGAESLCTAANIFVGIESATTIQPYLARMTRSEFCTILTGGMATVASSTLAIYVLFLKDTFPAIAGHLISASLLSAPAALVMSKLVYPEEEHPETLGQHVALYQSPSSSGMEAIINGATAGVKLVVGVAALLIALLGLLSLINLGISQAGVWFGAELGTPGEWRLETLLAYVFWPLAVLIGVPPGDASQVGAMLGQRLILTEIPAYMRLAELLAQHGLQHPRSAVIAAYSLCGFAHVASLSIFVGGTAALAPSRGGDIAAAAPRALLAATLACLMTGAVAGIFYTHSNLVIQAP